MSTENDAATTMTSVDSTVVDDSAPTGMAQLNAALTARRRALAQLAAANSHDETVIVPDRALAEIAELAWSNEGSVIELPSQHSSHPLIRWCIAIIALLATAASVTWLAVDFYHEGQQAAPAATVSTTPTVKPPALPLPPPGKPIPSPAPTTDSPTMPPVQHEVPPPPPPPTANVNPQTLALYRSLLAEDGISQNDSDISYGAAAICENAAAGSIQPPASLRPDPRDPDPGSTLPPNWQMYVVRDNIQSFCPQYLAQFPQYSN